jgi:hypothetical protein
MLCYCSKNLDPHLKKEHCDMEEENFKNDPGEEGWLSANGNGISKTTFVNVVHNVSDALFEHFVLQYIKLPTWREARIFNRT